METVLLHATVIVRGALRRLRPDRTTTQSDSSTPSDRVAAPLRRTVGRDAAATFVTRAGAHRASRLDLLTDRATRVVRGAGRRARTHFDHRLGGTERALPIGVALLILLGSLSGVVGATGGQAGAGRTSAAGTGNANGAGSPPRIAIAALESGPANGQLAAGLSGPPVGNVDAGNPIVLTDRRANGATQPTGPYLADGTLLKPIAVNTTVIDGAGTLQTYRVRSGDTLTGIANHFGLSMMTIWWANHLQSKDALHVGQQLTIPPVDGTVHVVKAGETLAGIAKAADVPSADIVSFNGLTDPTVVVGQTLMVPGGRGANIIEPKPVAAVRSSGGVGVRVSPPTSFGGGAFAWPVPGGFISQYFHYGHQALDIAADYGSRIVAAAPGTVIYAGWKDNDGGYQVWIAHGSGLYTGYYHMSAITVGVGERVGRSEQIGRIGTSGAATGPHCHFEVWRGYPWENGSFRVNPLSYL